MVGVLILTHGGLAVELLQAARRISGCSDRMEALSLDWDTPLDEARPTVLEAVRAIDEGDGVLILVDLYGSTPFNLAQELRRESESVEVIAGVNLPMAVRLACPTRNGQTLAEVVDWVLQKGRRSICRCEDQCNG